MQLFQLLLLLLHPFYDLLSKTTWHQKGKPFWILLEQEMMVWQWHQLDHMQIICTSLQTDNHTSTLPLKFLHARCPSCCPTNSIKALKNSYWNITLKHWACLEQMTVYVQSSVYYTVGRLWPVSSVGYCNTYSHVPSSAVLDCAFTKCIRWIRSLALAFCWYYC